MTTISGVLIDGAGQVLPNVQIQLTALKTSSKVLNQSKALITTTSTSGAYSIDAQVGHYAVTVIRAGFPIEKVGRITIYVDSNDGTLNDFLLYPEENEITPELLAQIAQLNEEAQKSATKATQAVTDVKAYANTATSSANLAAKSAQIAKDNAVSASQSLLNANNAASSAQKSAETSSQAVTDIKNTAKAVSDLATEVKSNADNVTKLTEKNGTIAEETQKCASEAKQSASLANQSAEDAKATLDNAVKKSGEKSQSVDGVLDVTELKENGQRVYSPNNKPDAGDINAVALTGKKSQTVEGELNVTTLEEGGVRVYSPNNKPPDATTSIAGITKLSSQIDSDSEKIAANLLAVKKVNDLLKTLSDKILILGEFRLFPFRKENLPVGWYFRNGDNYLLSSKQGQALNSLSDNYKADHNITIKTLNGEQYINVPNTFNSSGYGYFERPVNGISRQVGHIENDAIREINGQFISFNGSSGAFSFGGRFQLDATAAAYDASLNLAYINFAASNSTIVDKENRPINYGMTPAIYLGVKND